MTKNEVLNMINHLESKVEKTRMQFYEVTDRLIEQLNKKADEKTILKCQNKINTINQAYNIFLDSLNN